MPLGGAKLTAVSSTRCRFLALLRGAAIVLTAFCLFVPVLGIAPAGAQEPSGNSVALEDIKLRDELIANQENLLNTYRCLFGVDTNVVPGGCPNPSVVFPGAVPENPTQEDVDVRDALIQGQAICWGNNN